MSFLFLKTGWCGLLWDSVLWNRFTIQKGATHSSLMNFFKSLYSSMARPVDSTSFELNKPKLDGVSSYLFQFVKEGYGGDVVEAVVKANQMYKKEVVQFTSNLLDHGRMQHCFGKAKARLQHRREALCSSASSA